MRTTHLIASRPKSVSTLGSRTSRRSDLRDFGLLTLLVSAFLTAGYLALWAPVLSRLRP